MYRSPRSELCSTTEVVPLDYRPCKRIYTTKSSEEKGLVFSTNFRYDEEIVDLKLAGKIKKGAVGVLPTDTIYGLAASAFSKKAVKKINELKSRSSNSPFIILISDISDLKLFGIKLNTNESRIISKLWPNPISIILPTDSKKYQYLHLGTNTLAFRLPKQKWLQAFLAESGPIVSTSANVEGQPSATSIPEARTYFGDKVDFYFDVGVLKERASTIVALKEGEIFLLREGNFGIPKSLRYYRMYKKKTWPQEFKAVAAGQKKFDMRLADFSAETGDLLVLEEWDPKSKQYTGKRIEKRIGYVLKFRLNEYPFASKDDLEKFGLQILSLE